MGKKKPTLFIFAPLVVHAKYTKSSVKLCSRMQWKQYSWESAGWYELQNFWVDLSFFYLC